MIMTLIAPTPPDISAFGVRSLSSYLRANGHETKIIFLPGSIGLLKEGGKFIYNYDKLVLEQIVEICRGSDLIGVSFMSNYFDRALQVTEGIKGHLAVPVIWGGIHPSCKPEESLKYADMVCIGEGEEALLELLDRFKGRKEYSDIGGIWFRKGSEIVKNQIRPLINGLDALPQFDFSNANHFIYDKDSRKIVPLNDEIFMKTLPLLPYFNNTLKRAYRTMTDRGCPHKCAYCNVSNIKAMYKNDKSPYLRERSIKKVIDELVDIKRRFPFVEVIQFFDDTFFARPYRQLEEFAILYKEQVSLPFYCQASPTTLSEEKLKCLVAAGLVYVEMGIQTGSKRIKELYHRLESNEKILEGTNLLQKYSSKLMAPDYHIIIDNPWETWEDTMETVRLLFKAPKPYGLCISSLVFFPQTELYNKAIREGIIKDELSEIYRKPFYVPPKRTYPNFLIYLLTFQRFPRWILRLLLNKQVATFLAQKKLSVFYRASYAIGETLRFSMKGGRAVLRGDWKRILNYCEHLIVKDPVVAGRKK